MSTHEGRHSLVRPSVILAAALSCGVVCAAAVGALTAPAVATALVLALFVGAISLHEQDQLAARRANPFSVVAGRPQPATVRIDAPRARQATQHADVA